MFGSLWINSLERILEKITPNYPEIEENYARDLYSLGYDEPENVRQGKLNEIANNDNKILLKTILYIIIGAIIIGWLFPT